MGPRAPSARLIVDANIVVSAVLGFRSRYALEIVSSRRALVTSLIVRTEVLRVIAAVAARPLERLEDAEELLALMAITEASDEMTNFDAARALRNAPASRNGSTNDAHLLALAWTHDADIWSHDRDFAGAGWPSWSSANLVAALDAQPI